MLARLPPACTWLALAQIGRRVLVVDNDPQSSATAGFLGSQPARQLDPAATIAAIYAGDDPFPETVIRPTGFDRIDLLPGSRLAARFNVPQPHEAPHEAQARICDFLHQVRDQYDLVIIDNPPNLHMASWAAMAASDHLLVPVMPEDFGAQGTQDVAESAVDGPGRDQPWPGDGWLRRLDVPGPPRLHKAYVQLLREQHSADVFTAMIPESVDYVEAITALRPVAFHKPKGAAAKAVKALAEELLARLAAPAAALERGAA